MVETLNCTNIDLRYGSKGAEVTLLQTHLKTLGYYTYSPNGSYLKIDGEFLEYTEKAVKKFQRATGHDDDGKFGPKTCPDLNKKILAHYGISTTTTQTNTTTNNTTTNSTGGGKYVNPYPIDTSKNIWKKEESNIHIQGINIKATSITPNSEFQCGNWNTLAMTDGSKYTYKTDKNQRQYTIETYMTMKQFHQLRWELNKLGEQVCQVTSPLIAGGYYVVHVDVAHEAVMERKITLTLTEFQQ